ncbi:MAG: aminomethyl-transferring glycine dehydrogenase subunit GcvPA [Pseudomonadota bacterium]
MRYVPHTEEDVADMLKVVGVGAVDDLFNSLPPQARRSGPLNLPAELTEMELDGLLESLSRDMPADYVSFLGAGSYRHFQPAAIAYLLGRSEFVTSYTPYQPEMSQGTLQAIYEYQTLTSRLLGLEAANASVYDGAMALAEALLMAVRVTRSEKCAVSRAVHPFYRQVAAAYFRPSGFELIELPYGEDGRTDFSSIDGTHGLAAVAVQSPNFFGCVEDLSRAAAAAHARDALFVTCFSEPLAYGLLKNPGSLGADIACGEGQGLGLPQSFGGPGLGMLATKMKYIRNMPGRLVGRTTDIDGRPGFVLTLATREQHIRREKATSNICTNNSLCALAAAMYMASLGSTGMRDLALLNHDKAEYLKRELVRAGAEVRFSAPTFNEFTIRFKSDFEPARRRLLDQGVLAGLPLARFHPELHGCYLFCATEVRTREEMDLLVREATS